MNDKLFASIIGENLNIDTKRIENTIELLKEGCTVPFISRYRKERTGSLDEVQIAAISDRYNKLSELAKRKETIISTIEGQGKLTDELKSRIDGCWEATELEDIYLPFKPKRRTRAQVARENGLEPLAVTIMAGRDANPMAAARKFLNENVKTVEDAVKGAQDIIAETVSENERTRNSVRSAFRRSAMIHSKVVAAKKATPEAAKYADYFDFSEPLKRCSSHRFLAMMRGADEGVLRISISPEDEDCVDKIKSAYTRFGGPCRRIVEEAVEDSYKRLLKPSIETEFTNLSKEKADDDAIAIFGENLRQLLLSAPLGQKRVMGIDPGYRTGCKVVCLDAQGNLL